MFLCMQLFINTSVNEPNYDNIMAGDCDTYLGKIDTNWLFNELKDSGRDVSSNMIAYKY